MAPTRQKSKKRPPLEYSWASNNNDSLDHLTFFNHFSHLSRRTVTSRFNNLLKNYIVDETTKKQVHEKYQTWRTSNEARIYWSEREAHQKKLIASNNNMAASSLNSSNAASSLDDSASSSGSSSSVSTTSSVGLNSKEIRELMKSNTFPINNENALKINDVNILQRFHEFQNSLGTCDLTYKDHLHHILSTLGILLVKKNQHPDLLKFIDNKTASMMQENTFEQIGLHSQKFSRDLLVQLFEIVQQYITEKITMIKASQQLLALINEEGNNYQNKVILCFKSLIEQLPNDSFETKELELTSRFIQPMLQPLFEEKAENVYFRSTNTQTEEYKKDTMKCSSKRPDGCITLKTLDINLGFMEIKEEMYKKNKAKLNKDLYKLGIFSKDAIVQNNLLGVLSFQIVGTSISFYLTEQQCKGFYTMTELDHLDAPENLKEIPKLIGFVDNLCNLLHVFKTRCRQQ
ncbi:hypothetical protein BD770DRAFT_426581 [Pilaira anomala]|nr:hypothetical protein BD770DRAFT_426581 [Pilaira anomala]